MLAQTHPSTAFEIILVDDGSVDGTAEWARSIDAPCSLTVLRQEGSGPASARNRGIAAAAGDLLLFLDDDLICDALLLAEHAAAHEAQPGGVVHGRIDLSECSPRTLAAHATRCWYENYHSQVLAEGALWPDRVGFLNANTSFPAAVIEDLGGFDEQIPFPREDFELGLRVCEAGIRLAYRADARAYEVFEKTSHALMRDRAAEAEADLMICRKHPGYRGKSSLGPGEPPSLRKAIARGVARRLPKGVEHVLGPLVRVSEREATRPRARSLGLRLLDIQRQLVYEHAAIQHAGSTDRLAGEFGRWLPILLYHRVGPPVPGTVADLTVAPDRFERQIRWLRRRGYSAITPSRWHAWRMGHARLPRRPILITFDDCYANLGDYALPTLDRCGFPAAVFVVTERIGDFNDWDPGDNTSLGRTMSASEIASWARKGIEFGAHGRTHRDLSVLSGQEIQNEVAGSRADLEGLLDQPVGSFAYPYGGYSQAAHDAVAASYDLAFVANGRVNTLSTSPHRLRRVLALDRDSGPELEWRAWTGRDPLPMRITRHISRGRFGPIPPRRAS